MYKLREISRGNFDDRGYSNEESLAALMLEKPDKINNMLTYTYGMDDDRFPLTFLTEGQGASKTVKTVEWTWDIMGRQKYTDFVTYFDATADPKPGIGGRIMEIHFATHLMIEQYGIESPSGRMCRIMKDCGKSPYGYKYLISLADADPTVALPTSDFTTGIYWSMGAPTITESYSKGNRTNAMGPGKMKSQLGFHRYSKEIAGNVSNVIVEYEFKTGDGGTTNRWINEEMRQFDVNMRILNEEHLWKSRYNRNANGDVVLTDLDNDKPIPTTAGAFEIAEESNYDTYGITLPLNKINRTIGDLFSKDTDTGSMEVTLFGGLGGIEDFDMGIRSDAKSEGFLTPLGDKMIGEESGYLTYGKYFRKYKTPDGHIVTVKHLPFLDRGTTADKDKANGNVHPRTGRPMCSHQLICLDQSIYNGERNIKMVKQKNVEYKIGILKGLTDIPESWGVLRDTARIDTEIDMSRYEVKMSRGLQIDKQEHCCLLSCKL